MSGTERSATLAAAEVGLLALALGTAAGFTRLFVGWEFLGALLPLIVLGWACALLLRRLRVPPTAATIVHLAVGVVVLTVRFAPGTHTLGLPSTHTLSTIAQSVDASFSEFSRLVAPVQVTDGFLVVIAAALWLFALFADTAALRYRGVVQAAIPHTAVFLAIGVLARESGRASAAAWFSAGLATYAITQVVRLSLHRRWVHGQSWRGARVTAVQATLLGLVALLTGAVLGPLMPGSTEPVVDLRELGRGDGPRTVVSPFVGLRSLLGPRSDQILFTVESPEPAYWRLTALEQFDVDRHIWVSSGTYSKVAGRLPQTPSARVLGRRVTQEVSVEGLGGLWLPGAYVPERISSSDAISFDAGSASIILDDDAEGPTTYSLTSRVPEFGAALRGRPRAGATDVDAVHLETPPMSGATRDALEQATAGAFTDYDRMLALQRWFRTQFAYDERVDYTGESDPLEAFLSQRSGFCQQFSSAFALLARTLGLPSRIAVGFTPGDAAATTPGDEPHSYVVRGRHAHAWPEVYFDGVGWVPFEPTPQRGNPQAVDHTGVSPQQAEAPEDSPSTTRAGDSEAEVPEQSTPETTAAPERDDDLATTGDDPAGRRAGAASEEDRSWAPAALGAAVLVVVALVVLSRRRHAPARRRGRDERTQVATAWQAALRALARLGLQPTEAETPLEFAARVSRSLPDSTDAPEEAAVDLAPVLSGALTALADVETRARYRQGAPSAGDLEAARAASEQVERYSSSLRRSRSRARVPASLK
jgi:transglutaminase-like putative cysteine protease